MAINWVAIGVLSTIILAAIGGIVALWNTVSKNTTDIENLKCENAEIKRDIRDHEKLNEATFSKIELSMKTDIDKVFNKVDEVYKLLIQIKLGK